MAHDFQVHSYPQSVREIVEELLATEPWVEWDAPRRAPVAHLTWNDATLCVAPAGEAWSLRFEKVFGASGSLAQVDFGASLSVSGADTSAGFIEFARRRLEVAKPPAVAQPEEGPLLVKLVLSPARDGSVRGVTGAAQVLRLDKPAVGLGLEFFADERGRGWLEVNGPRGKKSRASVIAFATRLVPAHRASTP